MPFCSRSYQLNHTMNYIRSRSTKRTTPQKAIYSSGDSDFINQALRPSQSKKPKSSKSCNSQAAVIIINPGPKPGRRAASRKKKGARHGGFDKQQMNQMIDEIREYEIVLDDFDEEDFDVEQKLEEQVELEAEVGAGVKPRSKREEDEDEEDVHFGIAMCITI